MDMNTKTRQFYIAKYLYELTDEYHYLTIAQIIDLLYEDYNISASRLTIKSDIEILKHFGIDIQEIRSVQNRYNIVNRLFDIPELKLLIDAVKSSKFITQKKSIELVEKIGHLASNNNASLLKRNLCVEDQLKPGNEKIYLIVDAINDAINRKKKIAFQYFQYNINKEQTLKRNGEPFIFSPLQLIWNGDYYYMIGVFDYKQKIGNFRVDRIANCPQILKEEATPPPDYFDINLYLKTTFRMYNSKHYKVELICDKKVIDSIIDRFGLDTEIREYDESSFIITVDIAASNVFYSWIFGFGGLVRIAGPDEVKNKYNSMIQKAFELT